MEGIKHQFNLLQVNRATSGSTGYWYRVVFQVPKTVGYSMQWDALEGATINLIVHALMDTYIPAWELLHPDWIFTYDELLGTLVIDAVLLDASEAVYSTSSGIGQLTLGHARPLGRKFGGTLAYYIESKYPFLPVDIFFMGKQNDLGDFSEVVERQGVESDIMVIENYRWHNYPFGDSCNGYDFSLLVDSVYCPGGVHRLLLGSYEWPAGTYPFMRVFQRIR